MNAIIQFRTGVFMYKFERSFYVFNFPADIFSPYDEIIIIRRQYIIVLLRYFNEVFI